MSYPSNMKLVPNTAVITTPATPLDNNFPLKNGNNPKTPTAAHATGDAHKNDNR